MTEFYDELNRLSREKTCIVGVGNYRMKDDAAGLYVADHLMERLGTVSMDVINVEEVPENYIGMICGMDCRNVVFVDAVSTGRCPGSVILGRLESFAEVNSGFSTHKPSLALCGKFLSESGRAAYLMGIEAGTVDEGRGLTGQVKKSADILVDLITLYREYESSERVYEH